MDCLLTAIQELLQTALASVVELVAHGEGANVERQADGLCGLLHVAASLHYVLWCDVEGCWTVLLLEGP